MFQEVKIIAWLLYYHRCTKAVQTSNANEGCEFTALVRVREQHSKQAAWLLLLLNNRQQARRFNTLQKQTQTKIKGFKPSSRPSHKMSGCVCQRQKTVDVFRQRVLCTKRTKQAWTKHCCPKGQDASKLQWRRWDQTTCFGEKTNPGFHQTQIIWLSDFSCWRKHSAGAKSTCSGQILFFFFTPNVGNRSPTQLHPSSHSLVCAFIEKIPSQLQASLGKLGSLWSDQTLTWEWFTAG